MFRASDCDGVTGALLLLDVVARGAVAVEPGLRLLAVDRVPDDEDAYLAWGLDRSDQPVAVYVTSRPTDRPKLRRAVAPLACELDRSLLPESTSGLVGPRGRILAIAAGFTGDLAAGPAHVIPGWALERWRWGAGRREEAPEIWLECLDPEADTAPSRADVDVTTLDAEPPEPPSLPPALTAAEVHSLIGPAGAGWPEAPP
jgi:hypothetical protein